MSDVDGSAPRPTGERRWPMAAAVLTAVALQVILPRRVVAPIYWLFPLMELGMLAALIIGDPGRIDQRSPTLRRLTILLIAVMTLANTLSAVILIQDIILGERLRFEILLGRGASIWVTNVIVFSLWFWEFDRGGPVERARRTGIRASFIFPEETLPAQEGPAWEPTYPDYLYLAFTNSTAFSPTDTLPIAIWAKMTMMLQAAISLTVAILVVARAVNILPG
jgi:hypothetical protein